MISNTKLDTLDNKPISQKTLTTFSNEIKTKADECI